MASPEQNIECIRAVRWLVAPAATLALVPMAGWISTLAPGEYGGDASDVVVPLLMLQLILLSFILEIVALGIYVWRVVLTARMFAWWLIVLHLVFAVAFTTAVMPFFPR